MDEMNTITNKGKIIAHHYWTIQESWLIIWENDLDEEEKREYWHELSQLALRNKILVEFREYGESEESKFMEKLE